MDTYLFLELQQSESVHIQRSHLYCSNYVRALGSGANIWTPRWVQCKNTIEVFWTIISTTEKAETDNLVP